MLCAADLGVRDEVTQANYGNIFLLLLGGAIVGFLSESLHLMAVERDEAQRASIVAAERARLARAVHDGVLQVLALVQRKGRELGGDGVELGRLAGEQESALRALIRQQDSLVVPVDRRAGRPGVGARPARAAGVGERGHPGEPVLLPGAGGRRAGGRGRPPASTTSRGTSATDAPAWVLLQAFPDWVELSVRDEGPGHPGRRLEAAEAEGRLGVVESIRGRVADLGGTAELVTGSFGTEWEISVPRARRTLDP